MADHTEFVELAQELIAEEGRLVKFLTISADPVDPTMPWKGSASADTLTAEQQAVFVPAAGSKFGGDWMDTELFKGADQICLVAGGSIPLEGVHLIQESDNTKWKVKFVSRLKPADQTILYMFAVTR